MADILHNLRIDGRIDHVFQGAPPPGGLDAWWTKRVTGEPREGVEYTLRFGPDYDWRAIVSQRLSSAMTRAFWCAAMISIPWLCANALAQKSSPSPLGRKIQVPLDYKSPGLGRAALYFEMGAPFDKTKPVVFIISDGQKFYVTRGGIANLQKSIFGNDFNVIGIVGRGFSEDFTRAALDTGGRPDWVKAWLIFNSGQWVEDIESVRKAVVGSRGKILLYGASGGATLVHEYLMKYGSQVARAYTESAADPELNRDLGISIDRFWEEIRGSDPGLQPILLNVLKEHPANRTNILMALQRQHFFVSADGLPAARAEFIRALDKGDMTYLERVRSAELKNILSRAESYRWKES